MMMKDQQVAAQSRRGNAAKSISVCRIDLKTVLYSAILSIGVACATRAAAADALFAADPFIAQVLLPQRADHALSESGDRSGAADDVSAQQGFVATVLLPRSAPAGTDSGAPEHGERAEDDFRSAVLAPVTDRAHGPTTYEAQAALLRVPHLRRAE